MSPSRRPPALPVHHPLVITEAVWFTFVGMCAVAFLAQLGMTYVGWPGLIAGSLVGSELTILALLRR